MGRVRMGQISMGERVGRSDPSRLLSPLRISPAFRILWLGQVAIQIAIWVQTVAAQFVVVEADGSTFQVALVQSAMSLPFLLVGIPIGVLADVLPRRVLLIVANVAATIIAAAMAIANAAGVLTPPLVLALTFLLGLAVAVNLPTWTASVPDVVDRSYIPAAAMLTSINVNTGRVVGPALGGVLLVAFSPTFAFMVSSLGFALFAAAVIFAGPTKHRPVRHRFVPALRTGFRHVRNARDFYRLIAITAGWFVSGSVLFSLLPVIAFREFGVGPGEYGWILALVGIGAVVGTIALAPLRARMSPTRYTMVFAPVFAIGLATIGLAPSITLLFVALPIVGFTWSAVASVLYSTAQQQLPAWVRARGIAYYLMASQGGIAIGSFIWGIVGQTVGAPTAFVVAAVAIIPVWVAIMLIRLPAAVDDRHAATWPMPEHWDSVEDPQRRAIVVVEYAVTDEVRDDFLVAMRAIRRSRRRTGARDWSLSADVEREGIYVEIFEVESWVEHMEQHDIRQMADDAEASEAVRRLVGPPVSVRHLIETEF